MKLPHHLRSIAMLGTFSIVVAPMISIVSCGNTQDMNQVTIDQRERNPQLTLSTAAKALANNAIGQGSSSVVPLVNWLKTAFTSMQYLAAGSGAGFSSMINAELTHDFAFTSSLHYPKSKAELAQWKTHQIRTVTIARDAISIVVNLPAGLTLQKNNDGITKPIIDINRLADLYDANPNNNPTWAQLLTNAAPTSANLNSIPLAFGRNGGAEASGTADAFWAELKKHVNKNEHADENHQALSPTQLTGEANSLASDVVNQTKGSLSYLSLGFALQNEATSAYQLATLKLAQQTWVPTVANVKANLYPWTRNFNVLYPTKNAKARNFSQYLLSDAGQVFAELAGFIPLATTPFNTANEIVAQAGNDGALLAEDDVTFFQRTNNATTEEADAAILQGKVGL